MIIKPSNLLINAEMRIAVRGTSFAAAADGTYTLDRWRYLKAGTGVHTVSQDTDVPTFAQAGYLFQNSLRLNLTTPDTTIAAGDVYSIQQRCEGFNFTKYAQKPFTLSFWVKATLPSGGPRTYCVNFLNQGDDRAFVGEYTINATNTWEYKTITVPASPSAGTWNYTNLSGLKLSWVLASGTTFNTTAGAWQTGNFYGTSNQVNGVDTGYTDFRITGVMINEGTIAHPFRIHTDSHESEVVTCQRYALPFSIGVWGRWANANGWDYNYNFPTLMRSSPTFLQLLTTITLNQTGINNQTLTSSSVTIAGSSTFGAYGSINGSGGTATAGNMGGLLTDNIGIFTAEL